MPLDFNKRQSIEEITNGRIKKVSGEESSGRASDKIAAKESATDTGRKGTGRARAGK